MEINKFTDIIGVQTMDDITEGRMVLLAQMPGSGVMFGSRQDLMGVRLPVNATEALKAKYVVAWPVNNARATDEISMMIPTPSYAFSLRAGGWDQVGNVPFDTTVHLTYPGNAATPVVIPSGYLALAYDRGVFTVGSGHYAYSASLVPGAPLAVKSKADGTAEAGKLTYSATGTIAIVERYDSTKNTLTFRTL